MKPSTALDDINCNESKNLVASIGYLSYEKNESSDSNIFNTLTAPVENYLNEILITAPVDTSPQTQAERIVKEFNKNIKLTDSCFTESRVRGNQINPGKFILAVRNGIAELHGASTTPIALKLLIKPGQHSRVIANNINQNDKFYGSCGKYVLNVPAGQFALATSGNKPLIYGEGCHVIHDANLKADINTDIQFVSQADPYIRHSTIHFLRVPIGKYANIKIGAKFYILQGRESPYIFNDPLFAILQPQNGVYFYNQSEPYICNGTIHILRIPDGKIAKIWRGAEAFLLHARKEPYVFDDPMFRIEKNSQGQLFFDATARLIKHGSTKRVMPHTGEVAVTYKNGVLEILEPNPGKPYIITLATHEVESFLSIGLETLVFPSEQTKLQRQKDKASAEEIAYECFTTRDSVKVGVKLMVAFQIVDPELALKRLTNKEGILKHIENVATVDMGKVIQLCSSQEFLNSNNMQPLKEGQEEQKQKVITNIKNKNYQDEVTKQLQKDLLEFGIELTRFNIETPKILDQQIASEMAKFSVQSAQINAKMGFMDQQFHIAKRTAEQEATSLQIAQEQKNSATTSQAKAALAAVQSKTSAKIAEAEAAKKVAELNAEAEKISIFKKAEAEAAAIKMKAEAEKIAFELKGAVLHKHPYLYELELAKIKSAALTKATLSLTSQELATLFTKNSFTLFGTNMPTPNIKAEEIPFKDQSLYENEKKNNAGFN